MTYKDTIALFRKRLNRKSCIHRAAYELAIEVLEKQIPKKPIVNLQDEWCECPEYIGIATFCAYCPNCGEKLSESLGNGYYKHRTWLAVCTNPDCCQRLDWGNMD